MRLKDGLVLREVAGQYIIVPTGKRVNEITNIVYISSSAAFLWNHMQDTEFTVESLTDLIMENFIEVTRDVASKDVKGFIDVLKINSILEPEPGEPEVQGGYVRIKFKGDKPEEI